MCTYKKSRVDVDLHNHRNWILNQFKNNKKPEIPSITLIKVSSSQKSNRYDLKKYWNDCQKYYLHFDHICFCLYIVMYAIDVSVTFISIFSDRGTFDISFFANVFHVPHTRCGCKIIVLPRESFLILERLKEWQTINENDPYVFPCFAVSVD